MQINLREICAINKFAASKEKTRYYLNGVFVHSDEDFVFFVATDGHKMVVHRVPNVDHVLWAFIIPRTMLEKFKFSKRDTGLAELTYLERTISIEHDGGVTSGKEVDGTFPGYIRVRPADGVEICPAAFNGQYCADFDVLAKAFGTTATISPRGERPALVTFGDRQDIYGALMPMQKSFALRAPF